VIIAERLFMMTHTDREGKMHMEMETSKTNPESKKKMNMDME